MTERCVSNSCARTTRASTRQLGAYCVLALGDFQLSPLHDSAMTYICPSTQAGWLWYCDTTTHTATTMTYGNADSQDEAEKNVEVHRTHLQKSGTTNLAT